MRLRRKDRNEGPDLQVECEIGRVVAVSEYPKRVHRSYARVITGLSPNPEILDVVEPLQWYVKAELMRYFDEEPQIGDKA